MQGVQHSDGEGAEPKEANIQQQPSGSAAEQATNEAEVSNDKAQTEEIDLPKLDLGAACSDKDKKPSKKGCNGISPKPPEVPYTSESQNSLLEIS